MTVRHGEAELMGDPRNEASIHGIGRVRAIRGPGDEMRKARNEARPPTIALGSAGSS